MLGETEVIGYGSAKKRDLTGSIISIKNAEVANRPAPPRIHIRENKQHPKGWIQNFWSAVIKSPTLLNTAQYAHSCSRIKQT